MGFLFAYLDESGMHADPKIIIVGGAVASFADWATFTKKSIRLLRKNKIAMFHASDFLGCRGEFRGWDNEKKYEFIETLKKIAKPTQRLIVAHGIRLDEYEEAKRDFSEIKISPYQFCLEKCLAAITNWAQSKQTVGPVSVLIEKGQKTNSETFRLYREGVQYEWLQEKYKLRSITVVPKKSADGKVIYPFQVSDMIAHGLYRHHLERLGYDSVRPSLLPVLRPRETYGYFDTPALIRRWFEIATKNHEYMKQIS